MRFTLPFLVAVLFVTPALAQETTHGPTDEKAQKTYQNALQLLHQRKEEWALDEFKKADKQDGGHCRACQKQMIKYGVKLGDWKTAELAAEEILAQAQGDKEIALAHYQAAWVLQTEASQKHKDELFERAHGEAVKALAAVANFPDAVFLDGRVLGNLHRDDEAKARFEQYLKMNPANDPNHQRAMRFISRPELVRARMAPPFEITTVDGSHISMDDLQGKVVLIDFWATWCGPCREALPHIRNVAKKFQGEPLVILSVSLTRTSRNGKSSL